MRIRPSDQRKRLEAENEVVHWLAGTGIPAVIPLKTAAGESFLESEGGLVTLLPYVGDQQVRRRDLGEVELTAMGSFLGRLHCALQSYPGDGLRIRRCTLDRKASLAEIDRLLASIAASSQGEPSDGFAAARLRSRRQWLAARPDGESLGAFQDLPRQPLHGDYQETNLFFRDGEVSAIVDWDNAGILPRAWEVARVLDFVCSFEANRSLPLLKAYRKEARIALVDSDCL